MCSLSQVFPFRICQFPDYRFADLASSDLHFQICHSFRGVSLYIPFFRCSDLFLRVVLPRFPFFRFVLFPDVPLSDLSFFRCSFIRYVICRGSFFRSAPALSVVFVPPPSHVLWSKPHPARVLRIMVLIFKCSYLVYLLKRFKSIEVYIYPFKSVRINWIY